MAVPTTPSQPSQPVYTVRAATAADVPTIAALGARVFSDNFASIMTAQDLVTYLTETYTPDHILATLHDADQTVLVATATTQGAAAAAAPVLAGFAILRRSLAEPVLAPYPAPVELLRLYVDADYHGTGVAKLLMQEYVAIARREGYETLWLGVYGENPKAIRFYEKCGFRRVGEHEFWTGSTMTKDWIMVRGV